MDKLLWQNVCIPFCRGLWPEAPTASQITIMRGETPRAVPGIYVYTQCTSPQAHRRGAGQHLKGQSWTLAMLGVSASAHGTKLSQRWPIAAVPKDPGHHKDLGLSQTKTHQPSSSNSQAAEESGKAEPVPRMPVPSFAETVTGNQYLISLFFHGNRIFHPANGHLQ